MHAATKDAPSAKRPYVIIHTHTSVDGNINSIDQPGFHAGSQYYQDIALTPGQQQLNIDAYLNGKTSTEDNITHYGTPDIDDDAAEVPPGDYVAAPDAEMYYVSIDPRGELAWTANSFTYAGVPAHVIEVLSERASNGYKSFLRRQGISYIIAGEQQVDYRRLLSTLHDLGVDRLMVGGGGTINWSFVQHGLVDELSVVLAPVANGDGAAPRLFTAKEPYSEIRDTQFDLTHLENLGDGVVWLRYTPRKGVGESGT